MLYKTLKKMISLGKTEGLREKIELFWKDGKLSHEEYDELMLLLG